MATRRIGYLDKGETNETRKSGAMEVPCGRLTAQQKMFVQELLADKGFNLTRAAIRAGYSKKMASVKGAELIKNPLVAKVLAEALEERKLRLKIEADRVLEELACIALRDPIDFCDEDGKIIVGDMRQIPEKMRRCIDGIKVRSWTNHEGAQVQELEFKLCSKLHAVELAMKHLGMLAPQKHDVNILKQIDWDQYLEKTGVGNEDPIEAAIKAAEGAKGNAVAVELPMKEE